MSESEVKIVGDVEIAKLDLRPGQTLLVRMVNDKVCQKHLADIGQAFKAAVPKGCQVMVLNYDVDLTVIDRLAAEAPIPDGP